MAIRTVIFHWEDSAGNCYNDGYPAAFAAPDAYGRLAGNPIGPEHLRCSVCAANDAVDGERIVRILDLE